jgi:peptidoglycan hydrolase-like protein with peptidoglycan-binding domain
MGNRTGKIMKVILAIMTIAVISTPCFAVESSISWTEDELAFMKDNPVIRLGVDPGFVPFEFIDEDDQYKGIAADYLALISERTGLKFEVAKGLTWPEEALKANIHAITSIAMNRIFTEWYRSRGYDFDITNTTQYDQAYVHERGIFDRISNIANEIFNQYITRTGHIEPMFAAFCDGRITQCSGMFQWGSVDLANQGYTAEEILKYYYGDDIAIIESTTPELITETYPGLPLSLGDSGIDVFRMQHSLNVISNEFPLIPKIAITGYFGEETENAVRIFQEVFNLPVTGIVDSETWYRIRFIYIAVANLAELISGGLTYEELQELYSGIVLQGASLPIVAYIEFFIDLISQRYDEIEPVVIDTFYGPDTAEAIRNFQLIMGVTPTGIVNQETLNLLE